MKTRLRFTMSLALPAVLAAIGALSSTFAQDKPAARERIGVYDSRSIAVAFAGSSAHQRELQLLSAERDQAKAAGDSAKVAKLEAEGKARQQKIHQQGFSTAPVDELLLCISNSLPAIQKAAGVT